MYAYVTAVPAPGPKTTQSPGGIAALFVEGSHVAGYPVEPAGTTTVIIVDEVATALVEVPTVSVNELEVPTVGLKTTFWIVLVALNGFWIAQITVEVETIFARCASTLILFAPVPFTERFVWYPRASLATR